MIEVPKMLRVRPRDRRGLPIPYIALIREDKTPDFRVVDGRRWLKAANKRLCGLCGRRLPADGMWLIGGPSMLASGIAHDLPMHRECAVFAINTCPFLSRRKAHYSRAPLPEGATIRGTGSRDINDARQHTKPSKLFLLRTTGYRIMNRTAMTIFCDQPWAEGQRWEPPG